MLAILLTNPINGRPSVQDFLYPALSEADPKLGTLPLEAVDGFDLWLALRAKFSLPLLEMEDLRRLKLPFPGT